jgi:stage V sporulation protein G
LLNITDVRVRLVKKEESKLKAVASITIDNSFVVHEIRVIEGTNGCFVAMPSRKTPDGEFKDTAHPIDTPTREFVDKTILAAYDKAIKDAASQA